MLFHEWQDFVIYPTEPQKVRTRTERIDVGLGWRRGSDGKYPSNYSQSSGRGAIIDQKFVVSCDDEFECLEIDDFGHVTIWTRKKVWLLTRTGHQSGIEKLIYVPRHPPKPTEA